MTTLTADRVETIYKDCLLRSGEDSSKYVRASCRVSTALFHPGRLEAHRGDISELLGQLPDKFKSSDGGEFADIGNDRSGTEWTSAPIVMEHLVMLGLATDSAEYFIPSKEGVPLPGAVPRVTVK